jgi:uncharacterized protein (TIGR02996 family)
MRAVLESPQDDLPRLVICDWLEENGQVDLATEIRESINSWNQTPGELPGYDFATYRRGFIESVTIRIDDFMERAKELFSAHPVTAVLFSDLHPFEYPGHRYWGWWTSQSQIPDDDERSWRPVPEKLVPFLEYGYLPLLPNGAFWYSSREGALKAMSDSAVLYGRKVAGLPMRCDVLDKIKMFG